MVITNVKVSGVLMGEGDLGGTEEDLTGGEAAKQLRGSGSCWIFHSMNAEITKNDGKKSGGESYSEPDIKIFEDRYPKKSE